MTSKEIEEFLFGNSLPAVKFTTAGDTVTVPRVPPPTGGGDAGQSRFPEALQEPWMNTEERFWAKVQQTETCWLWTGHLKGAGYGGFTAAIGGGYAHRFAYELVVGPIPEGVEIDHRCGVRHCVNPEHLRLVTRKQNLENRVGPNKNSTTGARGVSRQNGKYVAQVGSGGKKHWGGTYNTLEAAAEAAAVLRRKLFTHDEESMG